MDVKDYCKGMEMELTAWKAKMYDLTRKLDKLPGHAKEKVLGHVGDLNNLVTELSDRVDELRHECPTEWSGYKQKIESGHIDMRAKYEETMKEIGAAAPVSIPG
jgi:hypothetical protein